MSTPAPKRNLDACCAQCGAAFHSATGAAYEDGLVCPRCDNAAMACAVEPALPSAIAAFCAAFDDTVAGALVPS